MKTFEEWKNELETRIDNQKAKGMKSIYLISERMSNSVAVSLSNHFREKGYTVESRKCQSCLGKWDIIITGF